MKHVNVGINDALDVLYIDWDNCLEGRGSMDHVILQVKVPTAKATSVGSENAKDPCRDIFHDHKIWFLRSIFVFITSTLIHTH